MFMIFKPVAHSNGNSQLGLKPPKSSQNKPFPLSLFSVMYFSRDGNLAHCKDMEFSHRSSSVEREREQRDKETETESREIMSPQGSSSQ